MDETAAPTDAGIPEAGAPGAGIRWRPVLAADAVGPGQTAEIELGELDLVAWRSRDGLLTVCDSRCPHEWSHLAFEGVVDGDELVCTAHFWRFDAEGRGTKLNVKGRRDPKSDVAVVPSRERDGMIEVAIEPPAEPPPTSPPDHPPDHPPDQGM
jgi:phenylpropionate dioxygenase-like ring-hydroxylating dioxygenase large terminal subunit